MLSVDLSASRNSKGVSTTKLLVYLTVAIGLALPFIFPKDYPSNLAALGINWGPLTLSGQWWRLISSSFIHIEILHLAINMGLLYLTGKRLERFITPDLYLLIYLGCGISGDLAVLVSNPMRGSYGASASIAGVIGSLAVLLTCHFREMWKSQRTGVILTGLLAISIIISDSLGHSRFLHVVALFVGAILTFAIARWGTTNRQRLAIAALFVAALVSVTSVLALRFHSKENARWDIVVTHR